MTDDLQLMNYKIDTTMIPTYSYLRVCLSCWRKMPSAARMPSKWFRKENGNTMLTCSSACGLRWSQILHRRTSSSGQKESEEYIIENNPYFQKYKKKLEELKVLDPQKYEAKVKELAAKEKEMKEQMKKDLSTPPEPKSKTDDVETNSEPSTWPPKSLDDIMRLDLVMERTAEEIGKIWTEFHVTKDCVFGVVKELDYNTVMERAKQYPIFVYPLPRKDGYEFILSQFNGKDVYFTPLGAYQQLKENSPPCLTIAHFPELKEKKGIVLMSGQYDDKLLSKNEALNLVRQMTLYYGQSAGVNFNFVRQFNTLPGEFNYLDLIQNYKSMKDSLEEYYT